MQLKPVIVNDIRCSVMYSYKNKEDIYCIGSESRDKYFIAKENESVIYMDIINMMTGEYSLEEIKQYFKEIPEAIVDNVYNVCLRCNFITNDHMTQQKEFSELRAVYKDVAVFDISKMNNVCKKISSVFYIMLISLMVLCIAASLIKIGTVFMSIPWKSVTGDIRTLLFCTVITTVSLIIHEFSHAVIGSKIGLNIKEAHLAVFSFMSLACYISLPGIYFLKPIKRIFIWGAGMFSNLFLVAVSLLSFESAGELGKLFYTAVMIANISIILSAIIPFYISDGYFILATICKAPNLRKNIYSNLKNLIKGKEIKFGSVIYIFYFITTILFTAFSLIFFVVPILYQLISGFMSNETILTTIVDNINIFIALGFLVGSNIMRVIIKRKERK